MYYQTIKRIPFHSLWLSHGLVVLLSVSLFSNSISWIFLQLIQPEHRFSQIALVILSTFLIYQISNSKHHPIIQMNFNPWAIFGLISAGLLFLLNEYYIAINIISATFTILAFYALLGLFIDSQSWKRGVIFTIVFILLLPFGDYFDVFFGFPLRLASAQAASDLLTVLGYAPQNLETLIELENQLTSVDLSCSGVHGLWSGMGFFVLLTWIEQKAINVRWLASLILFLALVAATNVLRITLMVMMETIFHRPQFSDLIHNSLGIIGFAMACMMGWLLVSLLRTQKYEKTAVSQADSFMETQYLTLVWFLVVLLMSFNLFYTPMVKQPVSISRTSPVFPKNWYETRIPMNAQEKDFFPRHGAYAQKFQFNRHKQTPGSIVFVNTHYWKAHHDPKNCFQAQGYTLLNDKTIQISKATPKQKIDAISDRTLMRKLQLTKANEHYVAYYWFQSRTQQTADFSQRLFSGLIEQQGSQKNQTWTMVSLLLKKTMVSDQGDEKQLLNELSQMTTAWIETQVNNTTVNTTAHTTEVNQGSLL